MTKKKIIKVFSQKKFFKDIICNSILKNKNDINTNIKNKFFDFNFMVGLKELQLIMLSIAVGEPDHYRLFTNSKIQFCHTPG